jgi:hypothetical protein
VNQKPNPFSLYDFLGYFTPGSIFLLLTSYATRHAGFEQSSFLDLFKTIDLDHIEAYLVFVLAAYSIGHILSFVSSITVERYSIWAFGYPSKYLLGLKHKGYFNVVESKPVRIAMRIFVWLLLAPISVFDLLLGYFSGMRTLYAKSLDDQLIEILRNKINKLIDYHAESNAPRQRGKARDTDFFRYVYHFAIENAPNHVSKMQNYVALYGFLRTLCLIAVIVFWSILYFSFIGLYTKVEIFNYVAAASIASFLFFTAFVKFYRRFSLEALMAMAVVYEPPAGGTRAPKKKRSNNTRDKRGRRD